MAGSHLIDWQETFQALARQSHDARLKTFYQAGMAAPDTPVAETPLVAMDFETTGLDPRHDEIVSIGLVPFDSRRIYCRDAKHWIVNPAKALDERSVTIHHITHAEIQDAPDFSMIVDELLQELAGKVVVVHYRQIERGFLSRALMQRINEGIEFPVIDTMALEKRALAERQGLIGRLLQQSPGSLRLPDCRTRYSLPAYHLHHAMTDALATAELLQAQLAWHYRPDVTIGEIWC